METMTLTGTKFSREKSWQEGDHRNVTVHIGGRRGVTGTFLLTLSSTQIQAN
jgi:hypothetical protein